jgi:hypothetical protein
MKLARRHESCPQADKPASWNPTPGRLRAAFITMGRRKHRIGYVCLDCGHLEFAPDIGLIIAIKERREGGRME